MTPMEFIAALLEAPEIEDPPRTPFPLMFPDAGAARRWRDTFRAGQRYPHANIGPVDVLENGGGAVLVHWLEDDD